MFSDLSPPPSDDERADAASDPPADSHDGDRPRIVSSDELLQGRREVWIEHDGEMYRLRLTSRGRLYLSK